MSYYTERHKIRNPIEKTYEIGFAEYDMLLNTCQKFFENIAWRFPDYGDIDKCTGIDERRLVGFLRCEIPDLYGLNWWNIAYTIDSLGYVQEHMDEFHVFAIFDFIEFIYANCRNIYARKKYPHCCNLELLFDDSDCAKNKFRHEINQSFEKLGLQYTLISRGQVERVFDYDVLSSLDIDHINKIQEDGLKELLNYAIAKHRSPHPKDIQDSIEKIWDALERLKTYHTNLDKKESVTKIINDIAGGQKDLYSIFATEFKVLTEIGNRFRIRHHETNRVEITDMHHYDYFFNRCLSLILLSIEYLEKEKT